MEDKRFMIKASQSTLDVFDALCESADVDRDTGFNCLLLEYFTGNPYMQSQLGHPHYREWQEKTHEFVMNHCP